MHKWVLIAVLMFFAASAHGQQRRIEEGYVTTPDGVRLYYQKVGTAKQTVIQPGRLFAFRDFEWVGEQATLISYDMRNRGRSDLVLDETRLTIEQDVTDLETIRRHFGVVRFIVMGYSYLGKVAVMYAVEHPERVERIVQFGPVPSKFGTEYKPEYVFSEDAVKPEVRARLRELRSKNYQLTHPRQYCEEEWNAVGKWQLVGDPAKVDRMRESVCAMPNEWPILLVRHFRLNFEESGMNHELPREQIQQVRVPVLTVHGTLDRNAPYGAGREWAFLLPNGRLLTVEGAAHQAFAEARELVMPAVAAFLRGDWPAAAVKVTEDPRK